LYSSFFSVAEHILKKKLLNVRQPTDFALFWFGSLTYTAIFVLTLLQIRLHFQQNTNYRRGNQCSVVNNGMYDVVCAVNGMVFLTV
jgi:hypothetical protein